MRLTFMYNCCDIRSNNERQIDAKKEKLEVALHIPEGVSILCPMHDTRLCHWEVTSQTFS